jgi:DNA replication protein DnaC
MQKLAVKLDSNSNVKKCPQCGGTGWKEVASSGNRRVTRCDCFLESQAQQLLQSSHIPLRYINCDFASYKTDAIQTLASAKLVVEKWTIQYPIDRTGLLLIGPSGVGKTHLSVAAMKQLIKKGVHSLFCDYRELLKQIQNCYNPSVQATELEILRPVFETEVVLIDDIGAVKPSEWVWDTVSIILNTRYNNALTTIITSNFLDGPPRKAGMSTAQAVSTDDTLGDRLGERMRSRLFEMCRLVQVDGKDYRQKFRGSGTR